MNQRPSSPAVPIDERVDGFELRVGERRLSNGRQGIPVAERAEIVQKVADVLMGRRDEGRGARVVATAAYPILLSSDPAAVLLKVCSFEEPTMDLQKQVRSYGVTLMDALDGKDHGFNVSEDLSRRD